jgi:hypothetical protein
LGYAPISPITTMIRIPPIHATAESE